MTNYGNSGNFGLEHRRWDILVSLTLSPVVRKLVKGQHANGVTYMLLVVADFMGAYPQALALKKGKSDLPRTGKAPNKELTPCDVMFSLYSIS